MARKHVPIQSQFPYHVGARCINRDWFSISMNVVWDIMSEQLHFIGHAFQVEILAFVLMNNHFHLLMRTPESNLAESMSWFMRETSRALTRAGNRESQTYGGRYFRSLIGSNHYYLHAYKYLYANPLRARLADRAESYPFSTLPGILGRSPLLIPVREDLTLFSDVKGTLEWINRAPKDESLWGDVRRALHKKEFKLCQQNKKAHILEIELL